MVKIEKLVEKINNDEEYRNFLKEKNNFIKKDIIQIRDLQYLKMKKDCALYREVQMIKKRIIFKE